ARRVEKALPEGRDAGKAVSIRDGGKTRGAQVSRAKRQVARKFQQLIPSPERLTNSGDMVVAKSGFAKEHLRSFIERIERLEEEKQALADDIREVYSEAKGTGFDTKVMRQVVRLRKMESADRQEQEAMLDLYLSALGMRR